MLMESAAGLAYQPCSLPTGVDPVQWTFSTAAQNGFTVARVFAHGVNATLALQPSPGTPQDPSCIANAPTTGEEIMKIANPFTALSGIL